MDTKGSCRCNMVACCGIVSMPGTYKCVGEAIGANMICFVIGLVIGILFGRYGIPYLLAEDV